MPSSKRLRTSCPSRRRALVAVLAVVGAWVPCGDVEAADGVSSVNAATDPAALARQYVESFAARVRLTAGNAALRADVARLSDAGPLASTARALAGELQGVDSETGKVLREWLDSGARPAHAQVDEVLRDLRRQAEHAEEAWVAVRRGLAERRLALPQVEAQREAAAAPTAILSLDQPLFWGVALAPLLVLAVAVAHRRRHAIRRWLARRGIGNRKARGAAGAAAALAGGVVVAGSLLGMSMARAHGTADPGARVSPLEPLLAENRAVAAEVEALEKARRGIEAERARAVAAWQDAAAKALPDGSSLLQQGADFRAAALALGEQLAVLDALPPAIEADAAELERLDEEIAGHARAIAGLDRLRGAALGGAGLVLLGAAVAGAWLDRRAADRQRRRTAGTCPLCLGRNRLVRVREPSRSEPGGGPEFVRCRNVLSQSPREECDYTFLDAYRPMTKLCFPTLGVPQAGKTHWLAMLYWELGRGAYRAAAQFEKVRSRTSEEFDALIEDILRSRIGTAATQRERIPHPLVFHCRDRDPLGRSSLLVNVFDYSGEVTSDLGVDDLRRRRALDADGYLFFLDPTYPHEPQARALADFREDLRVLKGIAAGRRVGVPVALCVSKIDLLAGQGYALSDGGDAIGRFYRRLAEIDPSGDCLSPGVIEARSQATAKLRDVIWPGWDIERQMDDLFGWQYRFFPLTPVGLDGRGERDLSLRTVSPFGLLEPMLWLLEMNGYRVMQ